MSFRVPRALLLASLALLFLLRVIAAEVTEEGDDSARDEREWERRQEQQRQQQRQHAEEKYLEALELWGSDPSKASAARQMLLEASRVVFLDREGVIGLPEEGSHAGALHELFRMFESGIGGARDRRLAAAFLNGASQLGWPEAQAEMGFRQAMGLHNATTLTNSKDLTHIHTPDVRRALLNYYFAARHNSTTASMALGFRHSVGLGVPKSCASAVLYYNPAAEDVIRRASGPSGLPQLEKLRLSVKSMSGLKRGREQEVLQYYQYSADLGNVDAQTAVGHLLNQGAQGLEVDHKQALKYFLRAAEQEDPKAMSHLGHMFANGKGVEGSNETALKWFNQAAQKNHPSALYGLGYLYLSGFGVQKDLSKAFNYFTLAAEQSHAESQFHLGVMHLRGWGVKQDRQRAFYYFNMASHAGHVLAQYNAAMMQLGSDPSSSSCEKALVLLKQVAERGAPAQALQEARKHFLAGDHGEALWSYLRAAEMGSELGLHNSAFMLRNRLGTNAKEADRLMVQLFGRAADQMNVQALLQVADSHYYGRGVPVDWHQAAHLYEKATERSSQALFNLGYMHQFGAGMEQDLHLAKRFYDLAMAQDTDAYVPVQIALQALSLHSWVDSLLPSLPSRLADAIRHSILTVHQPVSALPEHHMPSLGWLDRLMDFLDGPGEAPGGGVSSAPGQQGDGSDADGADGPKERQGDAGGDSYDMALLLFLCVGLAVVLRRRQAIRQAAAGAPQEEEADMHDPVAGWVEGPAPERAERERQAWAETVRLRQQAHHAQQQHHPLHQEHPQPRQEAPAAAEENVEHFPG